MYTRQIIACMSVKINLRIKATINKPTITLSHRHIISRLQNMSASAWLMKIASSSLRKLNKEWLEIYRKLCRLRTM